MRKELADITVIMDRSGSMYICQAEAQNGLNRLVNEQKEQAGECNFTLVQFDDQYDVVYDGVPVGDVQDIKLSPRGMTALNDAVGKTINTVGDRLSKMQEEDRPGLVMVVIVTDGQENASQEFKVDQIRDMIKHQQEKYGWQFVFLGANQDAFTEANKIGIAACHTANYSSRRTMQTMNLMSDKMSTLRAASMSGQQANFEYSDEERDEIA